MVAWVPGPIGQIAAGIATASHLATGNYKKAAASAIGMVPGGKIIGAVAHAAVRVASKTAKAFRTVSKPARRAGPKVTKCNSFEADTPVVMADGSSKAIEDVIVGDEVASSDTKISSNQHVTALIRYSKVHVWVDLTVKARGSRAETISATAGYPFWVLRDRASAVLADGTWLDAKKVQVGSRLVMDDGRIARVTGVNTRVENGWAYNLNISKTHTYHAGQVAVLTHNMTCRVPNREVVAQAKKLVYTPTKSHPVRKAKGPVLVNRKAPSQRDTPAMTKRATMGLAAGRVSTPKEYGREHGHGT